MCISCVAVNQARKEEQSSVVLAWKTTWRDSLPLFLNIVSKRLLRGFTLFVQQILQCTLTSMRFGGFFRNKTPPDKLLTNTNLVHGSQDHKIYQGVIFFKTFYPASTPRHCLETRMRWWRPSERPAVWGSRSRGSSSTSSPAWRPNCQLSATWASATAARSATSHMWLHDRMFDKDHMVQMQFPKAFSSMWGLKSAWNWCDYMKSRRGRACDRLASLLLKTM